MSNHFPAQPGSWDLQTLVYALSSSYPGSNFAPLSGALTFGEAGDCGISVPSAPPFTITVQFFTPGTYGSFDQDAAEAQIASTADDYAQSLADVYGDTLENVQATVTIGRAWTFVDSSGDYATTFSDTMAYPA